MDPDPNPVGLTGTAGKLHGAKQEAAEPHISYGVAPTMHIEAPATTLGFLLLPSAFTCTDSGAWGRGYRRASPGQPGPSRRPPCCLPTRREENVPPRRAARAEAVRIP